MMVAHHGRFISYLRVSTAKQGIEGYGIGAQRAAVEARLDGGGWTLVKEFTEQESGRRKDRPELAKALAECKRQKAKLVVAKLDRLTRDTRFLLALLDSKVEVLFCDLDVPAGATGRLILTIMASLAEFEANQTSERTKAGLKVARERGKIIGGRNAQSDRNAQEARARAEGLRPVMSELAAKFGLGFTQIANELNRRKVKTPTPGSRWHSQTVKRLVERLAEARARM